MMSGLFQGREGARKTMVLESLRTERRAISAPEQTLDFVVGSSRLAYSRSTLEFFRRCPAMRCSISATYLGQPRYPVRWVNAGQSLDLPHARRQELAGLVCRNDCITSPRFCLIASCLAITASPIPLSSRQASACPVPSTCARISPIWSCPAPLSVIDLGCPSQPSTIPACVTALIPPRQPKPAAPDLGVCDCFHETENAPFNTLEDFGLPRCRRNSENAP
jgi:hypothetical protein